MTKTWEFLFMGKKSLKDLKFLSFFINDNYVPFSDIWG